MKKFNERVFFNWMSSLSGLILGITQIVTGIVSKDTVIITTGVGTVIGGFLVKD